MSLPAPVYEHPPDKVRGGLWRRLFSLALLENLFFGAAMLFSFAFAVVLLQRVSPSPASVAFMLGFWAVMAYLALPRLNRVLTTIYVPDYFIGRARTSDGLLGDPINLALVGDADQIHAAMLAAGWTPADPVDLASGLKIVAASLTRRSYSTAPVSPLYLFGRRQAFAYQQEVAGNPAQRHHVRFWPCPDGWLLPGGHRVGWLAAGTYDRAVGLSLFTLQVTHKIDRDTDVERDYVIATLRYAVPQVGVRVLEDFSTGYHSRNGGGDAIATDGDLPVVDVRGVPAESLHASAAPTDLAHEVGRRPVAVIAAFALTLISLLGSLAFAMRSMAETLAGDPQVSSSLAMGVTIGSIAIFGGLGVLLAWRTYAGGELARLLMLLLVSTTLAGEFVSAFTAHRPTPTALVGMSLDLLTIYALTTLSAREWTQARKRARALRRLTRLGD